MASLSFLSPALTRQTPEMHRQNFWHLYLDITWFGVLNGSALSFLLIYATRIGANPFQIGILNAAPALVAIFLTLPAGRWLQHHEISRGVFWSSVFYRLFYASWIFIPLLFNESGQVWALALVVFLMSVPGTFLAVGFNALFAAAVPEPYRGRVVGTRNALLALSFILTSLVCGALLEWLPFPLGYQIVFALGTVGAMLSSYHLYHVRPVEENQPKRPVEHEKSMQDMARPGDFRPTAQTPRIAVGLRFLVGFSPKEWHRLIIYRNPFARVVALLFFFHLAQHLAIPLFPLVWVNKVGFSDGIISLGNAFFYISLLFGSMTLAYLTERLGNQRLFAVGVFLMAAFPLLTSVTVTTTLYLFTSVVGGLAWSLAGGALGNYLLERVPAENRPPYLAWYTLALNLAVLIGSLAGPLLADWMGLVAALILSAAARLVAGLFIWRWG